MRSPIRMLEVKEDNKEDVRELTERIVRELSEYLKEYTPERLSYTKHSIMGPVGKLLSVIESGRFENKDALVGYVINVHNNTARARISKKGIENIEKALDGLEELRSMVNIRTFLRILREIDYAVYKNKLEYIIERGEENGGDA